MNFTKNVSLFALLLFVAVVFFDIDYAYANKQTPKLNTQEFITIVDERGNLINVPRNKPVNSSLEKKPSTVAAKKSVLNKAYSTDNQTVQAEKTQILKKQTTVPNQADTALSFGGEQFVDSAQLLEQIQAENQNTNISTREFQAQDKVKNPKLSYKPSSKKDNSETDTNINKQNFYTVVDEKGNVQTFQKNAVELGGNQKQVDTKKPKKTAVFDNGMVSKVAAKTSNQLLSSEQIKQLIPEFSKQSCLPEKKLKTAQKITVGDDIQWWADANQQSKITEISIPLKSFAVDALTRKINLQSYSYTSNNAAYYWPLVIFLNKSKCVSSAMIPSVDSVHKATWLQKSSINGSIDVPQNSTYMLITPLRQIQNPKIKLTNTGTLRLRAFD